MVVSGVMGSGRTHTVQGALASVGVEKEGFTVHRCGDDVTLLGEVQEKARVVSICDPLEAACSSSEDAHIFRAYTNSASHATRIAVVTILDTSSLPPEVRTELSTTSAVAVPLPSTELREEIAFGVLRDVDLAASLAKKTQGCTPADILRLAPRFRLGGAILYDARTPNTGVSTTTTTTTTAPFFGYAGVKAELTRCIELLAGNGVGEAPVALAARKMAVPTGMLLIGVSGTGKTALCAELVQVCSGVRFIRVAAPSLFGAWLGETEAKLRSIFAEARASSPCVVVIDDIDAVGRKRGQGSDGDDAGSSAVRALSALLCELDGIGGNENIQVLACTSLPWTLDGALLRQGRLEKVIHMAPPGEDDCRSILQALLAPPTQVDKDVDVTKLATILSGHTAATLRFCVRAAGLEALKEDRTAVLLAWRHFEAALQLLPEIPNEETLARYTCFVEKQSH